MPGYPLARDCTVLYVLFMTLWQSGFLMSAIVPTVGAAQSQSLTSMPQSFGVFGNTHAYWRSLLAAGVTLEMSHSCPLIGSAVAVLSIGARALGATDSTMCKSVGRTGPAGLAGSPTIFAQMLLSV